MNDQSIMKNMLPYGWFQWTRNINKWSSVPMEQKIERTVKMNGEMNDLKQEIMGLIYGQNG